MPDCIVMLEAKANRIDEVVATAASRITRVFDVPFGVLCEGSTAVVTYRGLWRRGKLLAEYASTKTPR